MSWTGLPEFTDDTITDYSRPSPAIESTLDDLQNKNPSVTKTGASSSTILSKPAINFVKAAERSTKSKTDKVETAKKPAVKYAKMYRRTSKSSNVRGNQRNWNNLKSQQLGNNFLIKIRHVSSVVSLVICLMTVRVKRLERELKARTPPTKIHMVDVRGRSMSVMTWVPKKAVDPISGSINIAPNEQAQSSNDKDIGNAHIPKYQMEEYHKLPTDSMDDSILRHNVGKPLPLGGPPGQVTIQSDFFFNKDLEYLRYGSKGSRLALSISKMKESYYPDAGLEKICPIRCGLKRSASMILLLCMVSLIGGSKDNDSTLTDTHLKIDEALDYRVKEFKINRMNPGLNTRF
nr:hypothetical protein [Tanacetum cinerariifolium]